MDVNISSWRVFERLNSSEADDLHLGYENAYKFALEYRFDWWTESDYLISKKVTIVIASVIGADVIISLSFGGYAYIYLEGGEILEENYRYYDKDKKRWLMVWNSMRKVS